MAGLFRFPHTPPLAWLGIGRAPDDKVLSPREAAELLAGEVVVEEKVDGANLGFSIGDDGDLRAQKRGTYLDLETPQGQWRPLRCWLAANREHLAKAPFPDRMLFGEWCYAVHGIRYTRLPRWFLAFDVDDRGSRQFWTVDRRNALAARVGVAVVPETARRHFDLEGPKQLRGGLTCPTDPPRESTCAASSRAASCSAQARADRARAGHRGAPVRTQTRGESACGGESLALNPVSCTGPSPSGSSPPPHTGSRPCRPRAASSPARMRRPGIPPGAHCPRPDGTCLRTGRRGAREPEAALRELG